MIIDQIKLRTGLPVSSIKQVLSLFDEGATIPFIARYRKERTGSLDEVQISDIFKEREKFEKLSKRKDTILAAITEQGQLTDNLKNRIVKCWDPILLEDLYLPFKKSRKTKADVAKENDLEDLARIILDQKSRNVRSDARRFVRGKVKNIDDALEGARYILAEWISQETKIREILRYMYGKYAAIESKVVVKKKKEAGNYDSYFDYSEALNRCPSHRLLAVYRGAEEGMLKMKISIDEDRAFDKLANYYIRGYGPCAEQLELAITDSLKRLLIPSIENEYKNIAKERADKEAIAVFVKNLRQLLLAAPLGEHPVLALDPGFRTGCKIVILDKNGSLILSDTIYPHPPQQKRNESADKIKTWINKYKIQHVAVGNGTAGRETYLFMQELHLNLDVYIVNENGASIYSASKIAREEFPDLDLTVRGAISIGRRLMDPLAELVKIDPKSIGVGQYQHDVNQSLLKENLDETVISCVNAVGINLNTASKHILQYVSGVGPGLAENIVNYRTQTGGFSNRKDLLNVPRMGKKAFDQAAGFLRIRNGKQVLDNTGIHPERYKLVHKIVKDYNFNFAEPESLKLEKISVEKYLSDDVGIPTLTDIFSELKKPGLDVRGIATPIRFSDEVQSIKDLKEGMILTGVVNNLTKFGAFVDLGIKESALLHISQITNRFIKDPSEILSLQQEVQVKVIDIDADRKRISVTMKF